MSVAVMGLKGGVRALAGSALADGGFNIHGVRRVHAENNANNEHWLKDRVGSACLFNSHPHPYQHTYALHNYLHSGRNYINKLKIMIIALIIKKVKFSYLGPFLECSFKLKLLKNSNKNIHTLSLMCVTLILNILFYNNIFI